MDLILRVIEVTAITMSSLVQLLSYLKQPDEDTDRDTS